MENYLEKIYNITIFTKYGGTNFILDWMEQNEQYFRYSNM